MPQRASRFWLGLLLLYLIHAATALRAERVLWADGSYYAVQILQNRDFALGDGSRAAADVLMELPVMAALLAGITDLAFLKLAFGLPAFLLVPVCLALCFWMAGPDKASLGYPLATVAAGMMNTELLVIHESRVALALFWPILFGLLDPLKRSSTLVVSALLSLPFIASYESAIVLGPVLAFVALERMRRGGRIGEVGSAVCLASAILATLVALDSIARPTHPANLALFRQSFRVILDEGSVGVRLSLVVLFLSAPWFQTRTWVARLTMLVAVALCGTAIVMCLQDPTHLAVESQYRARILNVILPPLAALLLVLNRRSTAAGAPSLGILGVLFVAQIVLQLQLTAQWSAFRQLAREELVCVRGLIPIDTALGARLAERGLSSEWMRGWYHPTLSFLDGPGPVRAVLGVWNGYTSWQPFDARQPRALPRLSRYGVDDHEYRSAMERLAFSSNPAWERVPGCSETR
jgi:hypothetical protein